METSGKDKCSEAAIDIIFFCVVFGVIKMTKKCYRCGSEKLIKVIPAKTLVIPELKKEVEEGLAEVDCGCAGFQTAERTRCRDCGFTWDYLTERQMELQKK